MELKCRDHAGFFEKAALLFSGKRFAALGARESGKSTFMDLLTKGELRKTYTATGDSVPTPAKRLQLGNTTIDIRNSSDVSGAPLAYAEWKRVHSEANYVVYFVNVIHLDQKPDVTDQIHADMKLIARYRKLYHWWNSWPPSVIGVTHCDKLPGYDASSNDARFADEVRNRPLLRQLALVLDGTPQARISVGAMASKQEAIRFLDDILKRLTK